MENGIIRYSEDWNEALSSAALKSGEEVLFRDESVLIEGESVTKNDWFLTVTNRRLILSKANHWKSFFATFAFGMLGKKSLKKKPAYEIPLASLVSSDLQGKSVVITTRNGETVTYISIHKKLLQTLSDFV